MVNMSHNRDNRCTRFQIFFLIFKKLQTFFFLFFFHFAYNNTDSEVIRQNHNGVFVDILVDVCHDTHFHKCHDYRGCGYADLLAESCYRDWCRYGYCSCLQFFQNVFLLLNYRLWFVMFLRFCLFFKRTLLHSFFVLLALAAAVFELRKFISFLFLMVAFFRILLVRLRFHLGKCRTVAASAAAVVSACAALAAAVISVVSIARTSSAFGRSAIAVISVSEVSSFRFSVTVSSAVVPSGVFPSGFGSRCTFFACRLLCFCFRCCRRSFCLWCLCFRCCRRSFCLRCFRLRNFSNRNFNFRSFCLRCFCCRSFCLRHLCLRYIRFCHRLAHRFCHRLSDRRTASVLKFFICNRFSDRRTCLRSVRLCLSCLWVFVCAKRSYLCHARRFYGSSRLFVFLAVSLFRGCLDNCGFLCIIFFCH